MDFVAIDVETANAKMSSICQIGMARYSGGVLIQEWKSYINPEDHFDGINVSIHGIDEAKVADAPTFKAVAGILKEYLENRVAVSHMPFDRVAISQASFKCEIVVPSCRWLDTARVVRRTWKEFSKSGYGLQNVCNSIGYTYNCHDALEDAKAAATVLLAAMKLSGMDLDAWLIRAGQPVAGACRVKGIPMDHFTEKCWFSPDHCACLEAKRLIWLQRLDAMSIQA